MPDNDSIITNASDTGRIAADTLARHLFNQSETGYETVIIKDTGIFSTGSIAIIPEWYFFFFMAILFFIAWARSNFGNLLFQTFQASVNYSVAVRTYKDNSLLQRRLDNILYGIYFLSIGFFMLVMEIRYEIFPLGLSGFNLFLLNVSILIVLFFGRIILVGLAGLIFNRQEIFKEYRYNIFVFNKLAGIILVPLLVLIVYTIGILSDIMIWISFVVIFSVILLRIYRGIEFSRKKGVFILYLFLYLCGLEIVPLLALFKWMQSII